MLVQILQLVRRDWRLMLGIFLGTGLVATAAAFLIPKKFEGAVLVSYVAADQSSGKLASLAGQFAGLASLAGVSLGQQTDDRPAAIATLTSRQFGEQFIERHGLLPVLFPGSWDSEHNRWSVAADDVPKLADGFKEFDEHMRSVDDDKSTGLVTVTIRAKRREQVAAWANAFVAEADSLLRQQAIHDAQFTIAFLQKELAETQLVEVHEAVSQVLQQQVSTLALANGRKEYAFKVVDPAATPEPDLYVWPNRPLIIVLGFFFGLALAFAFVLVREDMRKGG